MMSVRPSVCHQLSQLTCNRQRVPLQQPIARGVAMHDVSRVIECTWKRTAKRSASCTLHQYVVKTPGPTSVRRSLMGNGLRKTSPWCSSVCIRSYQFLLSFFLPRNAMQSARCCYGKSPVCLWRWGIVVTWSHWLECFENSFMPD